MFSLIHVLYPNKNTYNITNVSAITRCRCKLFYLSMCSVNVASTYRTRRAKNIKPCSFVTIPS